MKKLTEREAGFVEGYAKALTDMLGALAEDPCGKRYDPMTVVVKGRTTTLWSYAFDMRNGGRSHPLADYGSVDEIVSYLLSEALDDVGVARDDGYGAFHESLKNVRLYTHSYRSAMFPNARSAGSQEIQDHYGWTEYDSRGRWDHLRQYHEPDPNAPKRIHIKFGGPDSEPEITIPD